MSRAKAKKAVAKAVFLPTMRELARTYQAFSSYSDSHICELGTRTCWVIAQPAVSNRVKFELKI